VVVSPVFRPRPEEPPKAVLLSARNDVDVEMRDALTYLVVNRYESSLSTHGALYCRGKRLRVTEEFFYPIGWKIAQSFEVFLGDQESVPREQWAMIEKGQGSATIENHMSLRRIRNDGTERTHVSE
jgi:hypothetical protein